MKGIGADPRIGESHLNVDHGEYWGYGGPCLDKDMRAFIAHLKVVGCVREARFFGADRTYNEAELHIQGLKPEDVNRRDAAEIVQKKKRKTS